MFYAVERRRPAGCRGGVPRRHPGRAGEIARETGTPLVIVRDGVLVFEDVSGDDDSAT